MRAVMLNAIIVSAIVFFGYMSQGKDGGYLLIAMWLVVIEFFVATISAIGIISSHKTSDMLQGGECKKENNYEVR